MRWPRLFYLFPGILLFLGYFHPNRSYDQDLGRHLLTGKIILQTLQIPTVNLFSYTYPTFPFINHHWGSEVVFFAVNTLMQDRGLFILSMFLIFFACGLLFYQAQKKATIIPLVLLSGIYLGVLFERTDIRPELFSFAFLSAITYILYRYRDSHTRLIYLLPVIQLFWTNMHIYFPIGIGVTLIFLLDELITNHGQIRNNHTLRLIFILFCMSITTLINPNFLSGALYPLRVFQNYGYSIEENQTPFLLHSLGFHKPSFPYLVAAILILFGSMTISWRKTRAVDWLLSIVFTIIALSAVRNFPLFVFATFIPASYALNQSMHPIQKSIKTKPPIWILLIGIATTGFFFWQIQTLILTHPVGYTTQISAKKALDFIERNNIQGKIFNNFDIGSYITYRLYPTQKVFIDGRPEAYPASFIQKTYLPMQQNPSIFKRITDQYNITVVVFSHTDQTPWGEQFIKSITRDLTWSTVYLDQTMIVLVKKNPANQKIINHYGMIYDHITAALPSDEEGLRQLGHFYAVTSLTPQLKEVLLRLVKLNPNDCNILSTLTQLYNSSDSPEAVVYSSRYQTQCIK